MCTLNLPLKYVIPSTWINVQKILEIVLGITLKYAVAVVRTKSVPGGLLGLDIARTFVPFSIKVSCLIPNCSSLKITCSVSRFHISTLPDSAEMMYLFSIQHFFLTGFSIRAGRC